VPGNPNILPEITPFPGKNTLTFGDRLLGVKREIVSWEIVRISNYAQVDTTVERLEGWLLYG